MTTPPTPQAAGHPQAPGQQAPLPRQNRQDAPTGSYASPITARPASFGDALAAEWTKIRSVRSTMWTLGVMTVLVIGLGVLVAVTLRLTDSLISDVPELSFGFFGVLLGSLCVITLGVLTITSEYGTGLIRATLTACPSRSRVLSAKAAVFFLLAFAVTTVSATAVAVVQASMLSGRRADADDWLRATVGVGLFIALLGLFSLAVGTLVRHSAGAITVMIGVVLLPLVLGMFMFTESLHGVQKALFTYSIPSLLSVLYDTSVSGSGPTGWDPLWAMLGATAVAMAIAYVTLEKRDV
ncbi:ABC transporter permease subunit [Streptomyces sp. PTD5-9]|uniref:ABC transporter permease subunit n=1 Tax=Streptomyces sp. PTD5-9 TaxID=3120150 RepID=UPI00300B91DD